MNIFNWLKSKPDININRVVLFHLKDSVNLAFQQIGLSEHDHSLRITQGEVNGLRLHLIREINRFLDIDNDTT